MATRRKGIAHTCTAYNALKKDHDRHHCLYIKLSVTVSSLGTSAQCLTSPELRTREEEQRQHALPTRARDCFAMRRLALRPVL